MIDYDDGSGLKDWIQNQFKKYRINDFSRTSTEIEPYSRRYLTGELAEVLTDTLV